MNDKDLLVLALIAYYFKPVKPCAQFEYIYMIHMHASLLF